jgi:hypothetical protein
MTVAATALIASGTGRRRYRAADLTLAVTVDFTRGGTRGDTVDLTGEFTGEFTADLR